VHRDRNLRVWSDRLREGLAAVGPDTPAGHRLAESLAFFAFMREELPALLDRWQRRKGDLVKSVEADATSPRTPQVKGGG
jgi:hypothetical protein